MVKHLRRPRHFRWRFVWVSNRQKTQWTELGPQKFRLKILEILYQLHKWYHSMPAVFISILVVIAQAFFSPRSKSLNQCTFSEIFELVGSDSSPPPSQATKTFDWRPPVFRDTVLRLFPKSHVGTSYWCSRQMSFTDKSNLVGHKTSDPCRNWVLLPAQPFGVVVWVWEN